MEQSKINLQSILLEADALVNGPRRLDYGHPLDDYTRTAKMWSAILGHEVTAEQAALCMICVKISRECNAPKRDNMVDAAGYSWVTQEIRDERKRRDGKANITRQAGEDYYRSSRGGGLSSKYKDELYLPSGYGGGNVLQEGAGTFGQIKT